MSLKLFGKEYNKVLLVEPHADDVILSMGATLLNSLDTPEVDILTVTKPSTYNAESSKQLEELLDINSVECLGWEDMTWRKVEIKKIIEEYGEYNYNQVFKHYNPDREPQELVDKVNSYEADLLMIPLGIKHPMHIMVTRLLDPLETETIFYAEQPYYEQKRVQQQLAAQGIARHLVAEKVYPKILLEEKLDIFKKVYPSQWFFISSLKAVDTEHFYSRAGGSDESYGV